MKGVFKMWAIKNIRQIDYLWENGLKPLYEYNGVAYFKRCKRLYSLLDKYYIQFTCIPNGLGSY